MKTDCDVLIVGGGPAGGLAAWALAGAGLRVTLIEAQAVLGLRVCGCYLCPAGVALLDELDLRTTLTPDTRRLLGMTLVSPAQRRLQTRFPDNGRYPDFGLALRRPEFDNALLELAAGRGAIIQMGVRVNSVEPHDDGWSARLGNGETLRTRLLIGADGRKSRVAHWLGLAAPPWQQRVALHLDALSLRPTEPFGEMHVFPDGTYIGLNPIGRSTLNISALCDPATLRDSTATGFLNKRIQSSAHLRSRIAPLREGAEIGVTFPAAATVRDVVAPRAALIGDASGFVDPLTGEGIYQALWTAWALAREVCQHWEDATGLAGALRRYARTRRRQYRTKRWVCQAFQAVIRRPAFSEAFFNLLSFRQGIGNAFIGMIGNSYSPGQACWRMMKSIA